MRRRNSLLAALVEARKLSSDITMTELIAFLYIAENPGVRVTELATLMNTTKATASRSARASLAEGAKGALAPARGWVAMFRNKTEAISHHLEVTPDGMAIVERFDEIIAVAQTVRSSAATCPAGNPSGNSGAGPAPVQSHARASA